MKLGKFLKAMIALGVVATCVCGLAACSGNGSKSGVAATVNGTDIAEDEITQQIENIRASYGLEGEDDWGEYLAAVGMTPQSLREQIIDTKVDQLLLQNGAAELGVTVEDSEIDKYVEQMKGNFDDDAAWQDALSKANFTEESYRANIKETLLSQAVQKHFSDEAKVSDEKVAETAQSYATYYDGAKKSSHILIGVDDKDDKKAMKKAREKAQEIVDKINAGEISFEDAVKEYSTDTASAEDGGNVGWDKLTSFVTEYTDALEKLGKDEMSGPVESQFGVHIIKVTDVFNAPKKVKSAKDFPEEFRETIESATKSTQASEDQQAWIDGLKESATIVINDMPEKAPYNVDMSKYQKSESSESADAEGAEDEGSEAAEGEAAASSEAAAESEGAENAEGAEAEGEAAEGEEAEPAASDEAAESEGSAEAE